MPMIRGFRRALAAAALACAAPLAAQPPIEDAAWIAGRWVGEGLGGAVEEVWSPPAGGQMAGHFSLMQGGEARFYEIMLIDRQPEGLRMRVKHFNADFTGWEERDGWHAFAPVSAAPGDLRFDGLTMRRDGEALVIAVTIEDGGATREEVLRLHRAPLAAPAPLAWLHGSWRGTGTMFGNASEASLDITPAGDGFDLAYRAGRFEGRAAYRPAEGGGWQASWSDNRGISFPIAAREEGGALVADWGSDETERGRTTYRLLGDGRLELVDEVMPTGGTRREFARHVLSRIP